MRYLRGNRGVVCVALTTANNLHTSLFFFQRTILETVRDGLIPYGDIFFFFRGGDIIYFTNKTQTESRHKGPMGQTPGIATTCTS